jgi:hypothetical protein
MSGGPENRPKDTWLTVLGLTLLALTCLLPLRVWEQRPIEFVSPLPWAQALAGYATVLFLMASAIGLRAAADRSGGPGEAWMTLLLSQIALGLTVIHWLEVDRLPRCEQWQREIYLGVFNGDAEVPHRFRPLPYGFARLLERLTGDWHFACLAYRWFFTFWFLWASYRLVRRYHPAGRAFLCVLAIVALYPLANCRYWGQLTDPVNHTLFVLGVLWILEDRPVALAMALFLGVLSKETIVLLVPAYLACWYPRGRLAWVESAILGLAAVLAFLAARPGWRPGYGNINGTTGLMFGTNLGFGTPIASTSVPLIEGYFHVLLFVVPFVPFLVWNWRTIDPHLRRLILTLVPLVLVSNLAFGWAYESRNYLPLVPLLAAAALPAAHRERSDRHKVGA